MKFHIFVSAWAPTPQHPRRGHGLQGFREIIETIRWGLRELGHEVTVGTNTFNGSARNIVFGGQILDIEAQQALPPDTIFYNLEQMRGGDPSLLRDEMKHFASNFQIWDYSPFNADAWRSVGTKFPVKTVPIGFAPILNRIPKAADQDIDVLMYGFTNTQRMSAFHAFAQSSMSAVFLCGIYGAGRDELIARAKTVVNVSMYAAKIFEVARVSYLMANRKVVVADMQDGMAVERDLLEGIHASSASRLAADVLEFVNDDRKREELESRAFETIRRRDIRLILSEALT